MPVDTRNIQNLTNTASTPAMWSFNDFDASPVSTYSLETPSTSSRNGDINPFDSSFARYSSYTGQGISPPMFSPYTTPGSYWSSSPGVASIDLTFSPPQLGMTPCRTTPSSFGYSSVGNNFIPANYFPVAESLDITIVPPRKRVTPVKKPSKSAIDPAMIKKRSTIRRKQNSNRASETFQKIASTSLHAEEGKVTPAPTEGEDLKSHEVDKAKHKDVEMKYRMQMRDRYAELLLTLPEGGGRAEQILGSDEKTPTRGKILDVSPLWLTIDPAYTHCCIFR